jgi:hypothetical protein
MCAAQLPLESFCPHFSTNMPIIWNAPMTNLQNRLWIYRRLPPRPFSASVISNAVVLASLQTKGFPEPSTNDYYVWEDKGPNYMGPIPEIFSIQPKIATIFYSNPKINNSTQLIPNDATVFMQGWKLAIQLGIDPKQTAFKNFTSRFKTDENGDDLTKQLCGRGIFLSRKLDGIFFLGSGDNGWNEGFWIEFGSYGQIRSFSFSWPDLKRNQIQSTASSQQLITCLRAHQMILLPNTDEEKYFERIKNLTNAKKFTITKITPYYGDGIFGETPTNDVPSEFVTPFAELDGIADFGNRNESVKLFSPLISSEVKRLLNSAQKN